MVERKRKKSTEKDKSIKKTTKESATKIINTNTIKIVIDNKKPQRKTNGSSSGGKKKKAIEALKQALEKFSQLKNLAKEKGVTLPAKLGESPTNMENINSIKEIEALTTDVNNRIIMIERLLQGNQPPQQPQNLLGGEFAPRITQSQPEPALPEQPEQPQQPVQPQQPIPATQPDTSPQEYPEKTGDGVSDEDIANTLKEIADTVKGKAGKEGLDTGDSPPDIPSGMGVDTNPQRGNATDPASNPMDLPPAGITKFNQQLKDMNEEVEEIKEELVDLNQIQMSLEDFEDDLTETQKEENKEEELKILTKLQSQLGGVMTNLETMRKTAVGNDIATIEALLNDEDFSIGDLSYKGLTNLDDYINDEIKEVNENGTDEDTEKEYNPMKDPLLTDKRNYMDTLSKQLELIARTNDKLDIDFIDPSTLKPEKYKNINKALNDELELLNNFNELKNEYLRDLDPNKKDEKRIIDDISGITLEAKNLKDKIQAGIKKINSNKIDMFNPNNEVMEPPKTGFYKKSNTTTPEQPNKMKKSKKKKGVTSYFDDILNVPADYEKQPTPAPFNNISYKLRNLQGYSVDSFIDFEKLVVKSLGKSPDKSLDIGILKSKMDDLESARQLRLADLIKYQKAIVDNNIQLTPPQQSILDAYKKELSFTTKKLVKILVNKNKPGKTIGIFDNQGNAIGLIN